MSKQHPLVKRVLTGILAMSVLIPFIPPSFSSSTVYGDPVEPGGVVMLEDFENVSLADLKFDSARIYSGNMALESDPKYVRDGAKSLRIDYDFIGITDNPSQVAVGPATQLALTGRTPHKIGMWIYANNEGHGLTSKFYISATGKSKTYEMRSEETGIDWSGWKYVEAEIGSDLTLPGTVAFYFQMKERQMSKKNKGSIWIDDVRLIYDEPADEDMDVPVLAPVSPAPDQTLTAPVSDIILSADDAKSGIDPDSIQLTVDGQSVAPAAYAYDLDTKAITYHPEVPLDGGYHQVVAEVKDLAGNPASAEYAFTIEHGAMLTLDGPEEAVSNEPYRLKLAAKGVGEATSVLTQIKFDPHTLQADNVHARDGLSNVKSTIDNIGGYVEFSAEGLQGDSADALASIDFAVSRSAKMERGETYKQFTMAEGSFGYGSGTAVSSFASPVNYKIGFPYTLTVKGSGLQTKNIITVTTHAGAPVEGAEIDFTDASGPQTYVTVTAASSNIYTSADHSSAVLLTAENNGQFFATAGSNAGFVKVYLPDGTGTGYIASADVQQKSLTEGLGLTDAKGEIHTSLANLAIGTWKVQAVKDGGTSESFSMNVVTQFGGDDPKYVQTFVTEDMSTMLSVGWQTAPRVQATSIQYVKDSGLVDQGLGNAEQQAVEQSALTEVEVIHEVEGGPLGEIKFHKSLVTGLEPGTAYHYRVGYEGHWSAWYEYKTLAAAPDTPVSFVFVTDSHTKGDNGLEIYQQLISDSLTRYPDTQFIMHGGDMVDDGGILNEWNQFWEASSVYASSLPSGYTMGNHDVKGAGKEIFAKGLDLPENGPDVQKEYAYSFDSGEVHFIVLNSEADEVTMAKQAEWLRADLQASDKKWKIVMFHKPAYHTEDGRGNVIEYTQTYFAPVLEELKVDLVLEGHDHVYARTYPMNGGKPLLNGERGTVYLDGGASGWKFYDGKQYEYLNFMFDEDVPVYSAIQVSHDQITIQARTTESDALIDNYIIEKKDELTVTSVAVSPTELTLQAGEKRATVLTATYSDKSTAEVTNEAIWTSSNDNVATVDATGVIHAVAAGGTTIEAQYGNLPAVSIAVTVQAESTVPVLLKLTADPGTHRLQVGQSAASVITAVYDHAENLVVTDQVIWVSSDPAIASVSDKGLITGVAAGEAAVTASFGGKSVAVPIVITEVSAPAVVDLEVTPASLSLTAGQTQSLAVTAKYSDLSSTLKTLEAKYATGNPSVAAVSEAGVVTAVGTGTAKITVSYGGVSKEIQVSVTAATGNNEGGTVPEATPRPTSTPTPAATVTPTPVATATPTPAVTTGPTLPTVTKPVFNDRVDLDKVKAIMAKGQTAPAVTFPDTPVALWSAAFIERAARMGIITGYADGSFRSDAKVTRAEFAAMLFKAFGLSAAGGTGFSDTQGHWASEAIIALQGNGVITGYADGSFHPKQEITRAEMVTMLSRLTNYVSSVSAPFSDVTAGWAAGPINAFAGAGIVTGKGNGQFKPAEPASRAESVVMILRLMDKLME
ncbi:S-layer homology domain-containing protein [Paenibacillus sp. FSL R5-0912]|uniref:S-layer homology domain-containing protein n=1 Tax=Paenibacillus sp. FSL R5-0912 TaxID=1536771 RepID=UPI0006944922|nr:S-layer homology domain-containing protein [Paenibacillus sp. FSL R5-0912]